MQYKIQPKTFKQKILRFYALANISLSEPIYETMKYKYAEYIYLATELLGLAFDENGLIHRTIPKLPEFTGEITEDEIWEEIGRVYAENYRIKHSKRASTDYIGNKVKCLKKFLSNKLEVL